jgi:D-alanyl-D-alanine carboxypeptidase
MPSPLRSVLAAVCALGVLPGCTATPSAVTDAATLLDWMAGHREHVGLAVLADGVPVVSLNAASSFPLASVMKVVTLVAYGDAVADGTLRADTPVPLSAVDRWYLPGTDGGMHLRALEDWTKRGVVHDGAVPLSEVAWAMTRWSDNAAHDELLRRVGGPAATARTARRYGMARQETPRPLYGDLVAWMTEPDRWLGMTGPDRTARSEHLAAATPVAAARATSLPVVETQRRLADVAVAGTPAEWVRVLADLTAGRGLRPVAAKAVRAALEWPLVAFPGQRATIARFGAKGGSLPGVVTEADYVEMRGQPMLAAALFLRDLPDDVEKSLGTSFAQQAFVQRLAASAKFRAEVARRLG